MDIGVGTRLYDSPARAELFGYVTNNVAYCRPSSSTAFRAQLTGERDRPLCSNETGSAHWSPIPLVPHLIGPLLIGPPTHWSPNTLLELIGTPSHSSPISLVPHLIGPPFHSSPHHRPIPMVPHLIGPPSHWFPISLVPHLIGSPSHWSPNSSVPHLIGPPISTHASPIPLVPHLIGPPDSLVPHLIGPLLIIGPPIHKSPTTYWSPFSLIHPISANPNGPHLTGPLSHWSPNWHPRTTHSIGPPSHCPPPPISLVPQRYPFCPVLIGPPSHWYPIVTLSTLFSLVPHLIGPPL